MEKMWGRFLLEGCRFFPKIATTIHWTYKKLHCKGELKCFFLCDKLNLLLFQQLIFHWLFIVVILMIFVDFLNKEWFSLYNDKKVQLLNNYRKISTKFELAYSTISCLFFKLIDLVLYFREASHRSRNYIYVSLKGFTINVYCWYFWATYGHKCPCIILSI